MRDEPDGGKRRRRCCCSLLCCAVPPRVVLAPRRCCLPLAHPSPFTQLSIAPGFSFGVTRRTAELRLCWLGSPPCCNASPPPCQCSSAPLWPGGLMRLDGLGRMVVRFRRRVSPAAVLFPPPLAALILPVLAADNGCAVFRVVVRVAGGVVPVSLCVCVRVCVCVCVCWARGYCSCQTSAMCCSYSCTSAWAWRGLYSRWPVAPT